jgi:hypothetical protein
VPLLTSCVGEQDRELWRDPEWDVPPRLSVLCDRSDPRRRYIPRILRDSPGISLAANHEPSALLALTPAERAGVPGGGGSSEALRPSDDARDEMEGMISNVSPVSVLWLAVAEAGIRPENERGSDMDLRRCNIGPPNRSGCERGDCADDRSVLASAPRVKLEVPGSSPVALGGSLNGSAGASEPLLWLVVLLRLRVGVPCSCCSGDGPAELPRRADAIGRAPRLLRGAAPPGDPLGFRPGGSSEASSPGPLTASEWDRE